MKLNQLLPWNWKKKVESSLGEPETFFNFLRSRMKELGIETNDRGVNEIRYHWLDNGHFTVVKSSVDPKDTTIRISATLESDFKGKIYEQYLKYLDPWVIRNHPVPSVSWLIRQTS